VSRDESEEKPLDTQTGLGRHLARGIVVNLLNPKTALFFYAFLPQFVDPAKGPVQAQIFFLGALFVALATCTDGLYSLFASSVGKLVLARPGIRRARRFVSAGVYFALGAVTAATGAHRK
jgi:threonine/homoserine/homoserine lactone efflux protein